jgi:DNA polymerase-3 subunit epsilon
MRQIIIDTETTGLEASLGHRIIEIGCIELVSRRLTGQHFHRYINPERAIDVGALQVHGITLEFLKDQPTFSEIVQPFLEFIKGAELIAHNAPFDVAFIDAELKLAGKAFGSLSKYCKVFDTLPLARQLYPGERNNLDALSKRYQINHFNREWHGALLDAEILAQVYLAMTGGQVKLFEEEMPASLKTKEAVAVVLNDRTPLPIIEPTNEEREQHIQFLQLLEKKSGRSVVWDE